MPAPDDALRVRAYNVSFGDALLVSVPDRDAAGAVTVRHVLIDVGNVLAGSGGEDEVFAPVLADVVAELDGQPLDLYVMTHEHMDHVQGLLWAKQKKGLDLKARHAWLTASAAPDYYEHDPEARKKRLAMEAPLAQTRSAGAVPQSRSTARPDGSVFAPARTASRRSPSASTSRSTPTATPTSSRPARRSPRRASTGRAASRCSTAPARRRR